MDGLELLRCNQLCAMFVHAIIQVCVGSSFIYLAQIESQIVICYRPNHYTIERQIGMHQFVFSMQGLRHFMGAL